MSNSEHLGDYNMSLDEAINKAVRIEAQKFEPEQQPHLNARKEIVLYEGKYAKKIAVFWGIRDHKTGKHKFNNLVLMTLKRTKKRGWEKEPDHSITIDDKPEQNSVQTLFNFLVSLPQIESSGDYIIISVKDVDVTRFQHLLEAVSQSERRVVLLAHIVDWIQADPKAIKGLMQLATDKPMQAKSLVAALNYARLRRTLNRFIELIEEDHLENVYQKFLEENHWIFGSEYSELIPNRNIVKGMQLDFPLRRTVDGYLDIIEIKRPLNGQMLFRKKSSRLSEIADVVDARSQADDYLSRVDAEQYQIHYEEELDVEKVRAKVIIGRSGDDEQIKALRRLNARTNRIEILTFDQLVSIAERMLDLLVKQNPDIPEDENLVPISSSQKQSQDLF